MRTQQIDDATQLGRIAKIDEKMRFPWQDAHLLDMLKLHQESIPGNASFNELMAAWLRGWDLQSIEC